MKRVGDPCRPSANPLSFIRSFFPLFRPSVLSPTLFPALIHEDSVLYNLILQSRAVVKAVDFTSCLVAHIYVARAHKGTQKTKVCRLRDLRYSSDDVLSERKISLPYKEADEKSQGKIAHFLQNVHIERRDNRVVHLERIQIRTPSQGNYLTKFSEDRLIAKIYSLFYNNI